MIFSEQEIKDILIKHSQTTEQWVRDAREQSKTLKALVTGEGFHDELIQNIEHLESKERAEVRRKYSKDIRDLFHRVMIKRKNVFDANGGSENININSNKIKEELQTRLSSFKANKSLYEYLGDTYFTLVDTDPNGVLMLEYKQMNNEFDLYPSYKSIDDIRYYSSKGQMVDYIVFEPKINKDTTAKTWRVVDDKTDWTFIELSGIFTLVPDKTFNHPFGKTPAIILSENCVVGSEVRLSPINSITELAKDYARDKSVLTIYKFQKGNPIHWRYGDVRCKTCQGLGKTGDKTCLSCDGKGQRKKQDVSDIYYIPVPKEGQPSLGNNIAGFTSPDLETWKQYKEDLRDMELLIDDTIWGTDKTHQSKQTNETATGRFIDMQPITNTLNGYSNVVEYVYNTMANWVLNFVDLSKEREEKLYNKSFGRRYIIESPDVLMTKYGEAKSNGDNNTILDKILEEYILSKYKSNPHMQDLMIKKSKIEPYLHLTNKEVFDYFGKIEVNKKVLFQKFWQTADYKKETEQLEQEFNQYFNTNNLIKEDESSAKEETIIED